MCPNCGGDNPPAFDFCGSCGVGLNDARFGPKTTACGEAAPSHAQPAERRQLSVLFCDLADSVGLSRRLDPEDYRDLLQAYRACCGREIARYGGGAVRYIGDGVRAYFGFPQAHENDAERAALAALAIVAAVAELNRTAAGARLPAGPGLQVRIGIATGEVIAAAGYPDLTPEAVGAAPNLAARAQNHAPAGGIVLLDSSKRLLGRLFVYRDLGWQRLRGVDEAVRLWQLLQTAAAADRFEATRDLRAPLVGRREQLALLRRRWRQAEAGRGQVVVICGDAGIGKSRLVREMRDRLWVASAHYLQMYHCSPFHRDSALYPVIDYIERDAGIERGDSDAVKLDKLGARAAARSAPAKLLVPLLAALLSVPTDGRHPPLNLSSREQQTLTFAALVEQIRALAERKPLLIVFEDVHWIDPTSQTLLELSVRAARHSRVLLLVTCRPDWRPSWLDEPQVSYLLLNRLDAAAAAGMIAGLSLSFNLGVSLRPELVEAVIDRAAGVPLFVEELTEALLRPQTAAEQPPLPVTLQDSLNARLDRLGADKTLAQTAAVIGREFSPELLAASAGLDREGLQRALERLVEAGVAHRYASGERYSFRHGLLQEAAYRSLPRARRRELHGRVGELLAQRFPALWRRHPALLARHFAAAGMTRRAVEYWLLAGRHAAERAAGVEARHHLNRGLTALATLPEHPDRARLREEFRQRLEALADSNAADIGVDVDIKDKDKDKDKNKESVS